MNSGAYVIWSVSAPAYSSSLEGGHFYELLSQSPL